MSGIYRWTHRESGKTYIGSSVDLGKRFSSYFTYNWIANYAKSSTICKALLKYGYSEFSLEILEYCQKEDTIKREQFYLDSLEPEYNILKVAGSLLGFNHTEETKAKLRLTITGRQRSEDIKSKISASLLGHKHSEETIAKLKEQMTDLKRKELVKLKGLGVTVLDLETNITTVYDSIRRAAEGIGCAQNSILRHEKLQLDKGYAKPFKDRYVIIIDRS